MGAGALGAGGFAAGRGLSGALDILNQPQQAVNSLLMALGGQRGVPPAAGTPRQAAQGLSGMMAMGGAAPGDLGVGRAASAASMMGGVEGIPHEFPSSLEQMISSPGDMREGSFIPALIGALAGGASALSPLAPFAIPIGAGAAGLAQFIMNKQDPNQFGSFSTSEVLDRAGMDPGAWYRPITDTAVGMATDPLAWAGAAGGMRANSILGTSAQEGRLAGLAERAAGAQPAMTDLIGGSRTAGIGTPSTIPMLETGQPALTQALGAEQFLPNEISPLLDDLALRTRPRDMAWEALARARQQALAPQLAGAGTPAELLDWNSLMERPSAAMLGMPPTNPMMAAAQPAATAPLQLPGPLDAGLGEAYGAQAMGMVPPLPTGAQAYQRVNPQVQALLEALGIPPEMQASFPRGNLPPWAQVRGGNVMMRQGVLPQDVIGGARRAAGY